MTITLRRGAIAALGPWPTGPGDHPEPPPIHPPNPIPLSKSIHNTMASEIFSTAFLTMILILIGLGAGFLLLKIEGSRP
ncbi:MAG: hypothetical protein Fur0042_30460 [Cyanophyceae cyanobacterium]